MRNLWDQVVPTAMHYIAHWQTVTRTISVCFLLFLLMVIISGIYYYYYYYYYCCCCCCCYYCYYCYVFCMRLNFIEKQNFCIITHYYYNFAIYYFSFIIIVVVVNIIIIVIIILLMLLIIITLLLLLLLLLLLSLISRWCCFNHSWGPWHLLWNTNELLGWNFHSIMSWVLHESCIHKNNSPLPQHRNMVAGKKMAHNSSHYRPARALCEPSDICPWIIDNIVSLIPTNFESFQAGDENNVDAAIRRPMGLERAAQTQGTCNSFLLFAVSSRRQTSSITRPPQKDALGRSILIKYKSIIFHYNFPIVVIIALLF